MAPWENSDVPIVRFFAPRSVRMESGNEISSFVSVNTHAIGRPAESHGATDADSGLGVQRYAVKAGLVRP